MYIPGKKDLNLPAKEIWELFCINRFSQWVSHFSLKKLSRVGNFEIFRLYSDKKKKNKTKTQTKKQNKTVDNK